MYDWWPLLMFYMLCGSLLPIEWMFVCFFDPLDRRLAYFKTCPM
jgi:hypothetical protein